MANTVVSDPRVAASLIAIREPINPPATPPVIKTNARDQSTKPKKSIADRGRETKGSDRDQRSAYRVQYWHVGRGNEPRNDKEAAADTEKAGEKTRATTVWERLRNPTQNENAVLH